MSQKTSRRVFLQASALGAGAALTTSARRALAAASPSNRPAFGVIGTGIRHGGLARSGVKHGPCLAMCDVDADQVAKAYANLTGAYDKSQLSAPRAELYEDYRRVLDRSDIDYVVIATPDHWHTKIAIEALHAGKDVYCEKPLTLTVHEGQAILRALKATGRVFQVGSQQRSGSQFQQAVGIVRAGRLGQMKRVTCAIGGSPDSPALPKQSPPSSLNWNRWLGQAPYVDYVCGERPSQEGYGWEWPCSRSHAHFRWWYEYAGGKLTDWGAHHVDIAMWGLNKSDGSIGAFTIDPLRVDHPVELVDGMPKEQDRFNTATRFHLRITFADGVELDVIDDAKDLGFGNGVMFEGASGRCFVNRGKLTGKPVEDLASSPVPADVLEGLYPGVASSAAVKDNDSEGLHFDNFVDCLKSRKTPISDVASHHRHLSVCHVANIALRLGRKLTYDPATETFVKDAQADGFLKREPRRGFEYEA